MFVVALVRESTGDMSSRIVLRVHGHVFGSGQYKGPSVRNAD